jgi:hypothetical protein
MASASKKKTVVKPRGRGRAARNFDAALWSIPTAMQWSGLSRDHIVGFIEAGEIEAIAVGPEHERMMPDGKMGTRTCSKYLLVATKFKAFVKGLGARGRLLMRRSA